MDFLAESLENYFLLCTPPPHSGIPEMTAHITQEKRHNKNNDYGRIPKPPQYDTVMQLQWFNCYKNRNNNVVPQIVITVTKLDSNLEIVFHNDVVNALP